ncbi:MAG: chorismate-binding protein, partial [Cryobacterium sp.]|nr:chorismate-binding protein [Cryobacterium sp.]
MNAQALTVETTPIADIRQLILLLDTREPLLWMRRNQGLAGIGTALRLEFSGATRLTDAATAWREVAAAATVTDPIGRTGTGLIAFGAFAFDASSAQSSVLIVPQVIIGRDNGQCWVTRIWPTGTTPPQIPLVLRPLGTEYRISLLPGALPPAGYRDAVGAAVSRIADGDLNKVVLARDLVGRLPAESDLRRAVSELALGYPDCWTYAVDGLVGSSPETLIRADHGDVNARVLAGTMSRGADAASDLEAALQLATSTKDGDEHAFAVQSVLASLRPHTSHLTTSEIPFTVKLPNLWHLATDVEGTLSDGSNSLDLIAAMHPTAAVAGTPTETALALIRELEPFDRGRYA